MTASERAAKVAEINAAHDADQRDVYAGLGIETGRVTLHDQRATLLAIVAELEAAIVDAIPALREYARHNPRWRDHWSGNAMDPCGVHDLLERIEP